MEDVRDDINNINTELVELKSKVNELRKDLDLMSIDIQTDLFTPLYTSPNEISRMTGLTSYISSAFPNESVQISSDPFFGIINMNTNLTELWIFHSKIYHHIYLIINHH